MWFNHGKKANEVWRCIGKGVSNWSGVVYDTILKDAAVWEYLGCHVHLKLQTWKNSNMIVFIIIKQKSKPMSGLYLAEDPNGFLE